MWACTELLSSVRRRNALLLAGASWWLVAVLLLAFTGLALAALEVHVLV